VQDGVTLVGWWEPAPLVTITEHGGNSSSPVIFASVYLRSNTSSTRTGGMAGRNQELAPTTMPRAVIALASWASSGNTSCTLNIDWAKLGLSASTATITAPAITGFQGNLTVDATNPTVEVGAGFGWLLAVSGPPRVSTN
jgi:hypothetical protein